MMFTIIRAPSPYNVILGRSGLKALQAVPSTIHAMMKFPTPRGIATLVTRSVVVSECRKLEDKQASPDEETEPKEDRSPEEIMPGEFVYRRNEASRVEDQGKLGPKWEGPYRVTEAYQNGSYKLYTMDDQEVPRKWHAINLRKYGGEGNFPSLILQVIKRKHEWRLAPSN
ncbi:reverse transcriptase domain-containing protein [Artemisia annua]|uniref:Reverse transcriptase domain-containing protein n=1 Tax=Artemisia annua TaxID=35608 RepID=A0A2U1NTI8_ARTAN|nr:reverse transcriptase domain-containing protein [Artemisia annua]